MATITLEQEINPWEAQAARFDFAAQKLNLDQGLWKVLRYPAREVIVHIASGNVYAGKIGRGEQAKWDEIDPKTAPNKAAAVALFEKSIADADAGMKASPEKPGKAPKKSFSPWAGLFSRKK